MHGDVSNLGPAGKIFLTGTSQTTFYDDVTNAPGASIRIDDGATAVFFGSFTNNGALTGGGKKYFQEETSAVGPLATTGSSTVAPAAVVVATHIREAALTVEGVVTISPNGTQLGTSRLGALTIHDGGTFDLSNNDLVIDGGDLGQVREYLSSGQLTSSAATDTRTLGAILNGTRFTTFSGQSVSPDDVLVKYTYFGDADLDGRVGISDFFAADRGRTLRLTGWQNGDFNHSGGFADAADFMLLDRAFLAQGQPLAGGSAPPALIGVAAVPEPAVLPALLLLGAGVAGRRRHILGSLW